MHLEAGCAGRDTTPASFTWPRYSIRREVGNVETEKPARRRDTEDHRPEGPG